MTTIYHVPIFMYTWSVFFFAPHVFLFHWYFIPKTLKNQADSLSQILILWYIYLHLDGFGGKCRQIHLPHISYIEHLGPGKDNTSSQLTMCQSWVHGYITSMRSTLEVIPPPLVSPFDIFDRVIIPACEESMEEPKKLVQSGVSRSLGQWSGNIVNDVCSVLNNLLSSQAWGNVPYTRNFLQSLYKTGTTTTPYPEKKNVWVTWILCIKFVQAPKTDSKMACLAVDGASLANPQIITRWLRHSINDVQLKPNKGVDAEGSLNNCTF